MKKLMKKLRYVKFSDILAPFIFILVLPFSLIFRLINKIKKRNLWLICEDGLTARDNGYHFYKYVREKHQNDYCFYVIDKKTSDYNKVKEYGNIIQFKSLKHWLYYLTAKYNISNHKHGNPCQSFFYIIHVILKWYNNRVFLQHGITVNDSKWIYYKNTRFRYFICGAKREYEYIKEKFGYPEENVIYTGFPRFDNLYNNNINKNQVLIMPTWRNWLGGNYVTDKQFKDTDYYKSWNELINSQKLIEYIEQNNIIIYFYPHQHMQKFIHLFDSSSNNIKIVDNSNKDIQDLLKESQLLITDYSSVFMDFAYMNKPLIYYQFDKEEYREKQLQEGYFDYNDNGFGKLVCDANSLINSIISYHKTNFKIEKIYLKRITDFFELKDKNNCLRVYEIIKEGVKNENFIC